MRSISATLQAAIAAPTRRPAVTLTAVRRQGGVALLRWEQLGSGNEPPGQAALTQLASGTLIRGRLDTPTGRYLVQSIADPSAASAWSVWPVTIATGVVAIALWSQGATAYAAWATATQAVRIAESTDGGLTWGAATTLATAAALPTALAGATKSGGDTLVLWDDGPAIVSIKRTGGAWGAVGIAATLGGACTGLACHYRGDFNCLVTGSTATGDRSLWSILLGDGYSLPAGTWGVLDSILLSHAGSPVTYHEPTLAYADTYRFFVREASAANPPGSRLYWSHHRPAADPIDALWREPVPFNATPAQGAALAHATGSDLYLASASAVWRAMAFPAEQSLTADLRRIEIHHQLFDGRATLTLANDDGRYSTLGSGANAQLDLGSELAIALGYRTSAGDETSELPHLWITGADYRSDRPNRADLILSAGDAWWLLDRWTARRSFDWGTGEANVFQLLSFVFARAGIAFSTSGASADLTDLAPAFTIYPGDTGLNVVRRLLALVPDYLRMRTAGAVAGNPAATDPPLFTWGATYPILAGHFRSALHHFNQIQVHGAGVLGEAFAFGEIDRAAGRLHQIHDRNVADSALAASRATAYLRDEAIHATTDEITVPVHPGLEILDPIALTDSRAGLSAAPRRVLAQTIVHDPGRGTYQATLTAGAR